MIKLKPYQQEAVEAIRNTFKSSSRQYVEMPTGSGKTITFLHYAKTYHKKILVIVPSCQLLHQVVETALKFYEPWQITKKGAGFYEAANEFKDSQIRSVGGEENLQCVHVCIINSIRGDYLDYLAEQDFDLTVIDEAHHTQANSYIQFIKRRSEYFKEKDMRILGVTATPDRVDGKLLKEILYTCSYKLEITELIKDGHLSDIEGFSVKTNIDISDIDDHNGDFSVSQLYKRLCNDARNSMIVDLFKKEMQERKTLIFCINIAHSKQINKLLNGLGYSSAHIDGSMSNDQKASILASFREGEVSVLCNCQLLTEGFDEPSIDGIVLARPTRSRALFLQMIGRGLRIYPGKKNCKIIDVMDNHKNTVGFTNIVTDQKFTPLNFFGSLKDIKDHVANETLSLTEVIIEKADILNLNKIENKEALPTMISYLEQNDIKFYYPITIDEASFLIWMNELKKEYIWHQSEKQKKTTVYR